MLKIMDDGRRMQGLVKTDVEINEARSIIRRLKVLTPGACFWQLPLSWFVSSFSTNFLGEISIAVSSSSYKAGPSVP